MPNYDKEDIVELKNRKKRRKRLVRLLVFLLIVSIVGGLFYYRDLWLPKLQGLGKHYETIRNDGQLAEGNFPIEINGGSKYQLNYGEDRLFLLSDAYIYYYSVDGGLLKRRQHAYSNAVLNTAGGTALIYESGGDQLSVENDKEKLYEMSFDDTIIFARISQEGYAAVVTTSDNYACKLTVYNKKGEFVYERNCVERIKSISFTDESSGCILSYIGADNGTLSTSVQKISFTSEKEDWTSPYVNTLGIETFASGEGAFVLGYTACANVDSSGQISSYYQYDGDFAGGDSKNGKSAVIINDDDRRKYTLALFDKDSAAPVLVDFDEPLKYVTVCDGLAYVMSTEEIRGYDFDGTLRSTVEITDSYSEFRRSEDYIFLMAYNKIDRIDYNS